MGALLDLARLAAAAEQATVASIDAPTMTAVFYRWNVTFPDGRAIEVGYLPEAARAKVELDYPEAIVEPIREMP